MIQFVHRGMSPKYRTYVQDALKRINRRRRASFTADAPAGGGLRVAICTTGEPLTEEMLVGLLKEHRQVTFLIGDACGLPPELIKSAQRVVSVSSLPIPHQMEAMILTECVEQAVAKMPATV